LDIISNARVELGIGAGWYEQEYVGYGYQFPANVSRIKQLDESLSIIKAMWKDECASFEGQYYRIKKRLAIQSQFRSPILLSW
jgi:alkanesulfonate monooxygenase SsuD/methylene tetrahydromethanopterin reductase-like flavin-dependent oxidoreductase (luciferase family)